MPVKRTRQPMPEGSAFAMRGSRVKWPTLRGAYLTDENILVLRKYAFGVIFLEGEYNTRLNFSRKESIERAVFFEHLHRVSGESIFLLIWVGNYHAGSIFHCAWQFPQMFHWKWRALERAAIDSYRKIAETLYGDASMDEEVEAFLESTKNA